MGTSQAEAWVADKLAATEDPEFGAFSLVHDVAFDCRRATRVCPRQRH